MLNKLMPFYFAEYKDGGRGPRKYDCWGFVRDIRHQVFGLSLLPSYGSIRAADKVGLTKGLSVEIKFKRLSPCDVVEGCMAFAFRGKLCIHVGIVVAGDCGLSVMHIDNNGVSVDTLRDFAAEYDEVKYLL